MKSDVGKKDWQTVRLGSVCDKTNSVNPSVNPELPFTYIDVSSVSNETLRIENPVVLLGRDAPSRARKLVKRGDIIFATVRPTLRRIARVTEEFDNQVCSTGYCVVRPRQEKANTDFIYFSLCTKEVTDYVRNIQRGVSYPAISDRNLLDFTIALPTVSEQKAIAQVLATVQDAITEQEKLIAKLKELKRSMMQHLFTKGTKGEKTKMTEVGEIPRTWSVCSAEELSTAITVGVVVRPASYYVSDGVPAFRSFNIGEDRINERDFVYFSKQDNDGPLKKSKLQSGDILVVRTGYPGTACVVPEKYIGANCIDLVIVRPNRGLIDSHYFSRFINSPFGKSQVLSEKKGLAQQHFNVGAAKRMRIPLPDINEQQDIVRVLDTLDTRIVSSQEKMMAYRSLFKTLLHELMSGERRISTKL